jgi:hypothetical protein
MGRGWGRGESQHEAVEIPDMEIGRIIVGQNNSRDIPVSNYSALK